MLYSKRYVSNYSKFLVTLAWTVEIIAVLIGFTISIVVSISAYRSFTAGSDVGLLAGAPAVMVAGLPFVLIAVVELCKIPLTFAFMAVKHTGWRSLFLGFVIFLCIITFETMLNGFERNFSNLNRAIDGRKNMIENVESEIMLLEKRRAHIVKFTEDELLEEVELGRETAKDDYKKSAQKIDANTRRILANIDYSFKDEIEAEIAELIRTRDVYYEDWAAETAAVEERISVMLIGNISGSAEERDRLLADLEILKQEFDEKMAKANFFTRSTIESKYRKLIQEKEDQLAVITTGYLGGEAIEKQSTMEVQLKQQLEFVNSKYSGRVNDVNERIEALKQEIDTRMSNNAKLKTDVVAKAARDKSRFARIQKERNSELDSHLENKLGELEVIAGKSFGIDEKIFQLRNEQRILQTEINHLINQNQIYRLAMYAYDLPSATDVERGMVGIVALLWFGSLSLIASICGVMLAVAGFYLRRFSDPGDDTGGGSVYVDG